jgi:hypothetical protein
MYRMSAICQNANLLSKAPTIRKYIDIVSKLSLTDYDEL